MTIDSHFLSKISIHSLIFCATYPLLADGSFPSMHWLKDRVESQQKSITAYFFFFVCYLATVFSQPEFTHSDARLTPNSSLVRNLHTALFWILLHEKSNNLSRSVIAQINSHINVHWGNGLMSYRCKLGVNQVKQSELTWKKPFNTLLITIHLALTTSWLCSLMLADLYPSNTRTHPPPVYKNLVEIENVTHWLFL